jgi:POT family proton-dependent oligopeptide transporter
MHLGRVPNDAIQVLNPIIYIFLGPVIQKLLYPFLASRKIAFQPIARITAGFIIMAMAMGYASGVQGLIYSRGPCYKHPLSCPDSKGGKIPNDITVWAQTPIYFILAAAEIFGFVTGTEYAYSKAPEGMKTVVQALWQLAAAFGGALGMALSPVAKDPHLVVLYGALGGAMVVASTLFWIAFKKYDGIDERLNILEIRS